jgi:hypothetical protein
MQNSFKMTQKSRDRIDAIVTFEYLLRNLDDRTVEKVTAAVKALKSANALVGPLPRTLHKDKTV